MKIWAPIDTIGISEVDQTYCIFHKGDYKTAAALFETIVHKYPTHFSGKRALAFLYKCNKHLSRASENLVMLDNISSAYPNYEISALAKNFAAGDLIRQRDYQTAILKSKAVINSFAKTEYAKQALFNLGNTYWYFLDDQKTGEIYYRRLIKAYPDDDLSISAMATLGEWAPDEPQPATAQAEITKFTLHQNYPNPFNLETQIKFRNSERTVVNLSIYNSMGQLIKKLVNKSLPEGLHTVAWNGKNEAGDVVASGLYFCCLKTNKNVITQKLLLVK